MYETSSSTADALRTRRDRPDPAGESWDEDDRGRALEKLTLFSMEVELAATFFRAVHAFWGPLAAEIHEDELLLLHADPAVAFNFQGYYAIEFEADAGRTIAEIFLARHGPRLPRGERAFARALASSRLGIYELAGGGPGESARLRDVWRGGEELPVEASGEAFGLRPGELIATRLTRPPGGRIAFEWDLYIIPAWVREELLVALQVEAAGRGGGSERASSRRACERVHRLLYRLAAPGWDGGPGQREIDESEGYPAGRETS